LAGSFSLLIVEMDADVVIFQGFADVPGVVDDFFADRADFHLHRREPQPEKLRA